MKKILGAGETGFIGAALAGRPMAETDATAIKVDELACAGNLDSLSSLIGRWRNVFGQNDTRVSPEPGVSGRLVIEYVRGA